LNVRVIGITGSVGKSTSKEAIAQVLSKRYVTLKSRANLNNEIGLPLNILRLNAKHQCAVLEMGFYVAGDIKLLCDIAQPQVGVITNIGTVHAERAGSQEMIARGKAELVEALPPDGIAILNNDDPRVLAMQALTQARIFTYGLSPEADLWADDVETVDGRQGTGSLRLRLHHKNDSLHIRVPMIGRHSAQTVLRAAAVGLVEGLTWDEIIHGLHECGRLSIISASSGARLIDDTYNASPESTLAALDVLADLRAERKIAVLGDMLELGQYEQEGHEKVGARAAQVAQVLITLGPRAHQIAAAALQSGMAKDTVIEYEDGADVVTWLKEHLHADDTALIKGSRGMRMEHIVAALLVSPDLPGAA
jgi:UDP-N-acetylmuramoyl-tripeptide--D-alanyl-D-alanine ligase